TTRSYVRAVQQFAQHFGKSPDKLGPSELRSYQAYLLKERKLAVGTVVARVAALRFFFVRTLKRQQFREDLPYPKKQRRLPTVVSLQEVAQLINAAGNLMQRALLITLYGTGMRRTEVSRLKVRDIDSKRMMIRVDRGKGGVSRTSPSALPCSKHSGNTGVGKNLARICFPRSNAARMDPSPIRPCGTRVPKQRAMLASPST